MQRRSGPCIVTNLRSLGELLLLVEHAEQFPPGTVLQQQVHFFISLEGGIDANQEGVPDGHQHVPLHDYPVDLFLLLNILLLHRLERKQLA